MHTLATKQAVRFPAAQVESVLRTALLSAARREAALHGITIPADDLGASSLRIEIDSLEVVELLCELDPLLSFEVGEAVVRAGGYDSVNEATADLLPKLEREWRKHQGARL